MRICIAQTQSLKGDVSNNIENHLTLVQKAIELNSDLIVFPELSITNYEPKLAKKLSVSIEDPMFDSFQKLAEDSSICIAIGMPTECDRGIQISMLIFQPNLTRSSYSKQILHHDEKPYFVAGNKHKVLNIKGFKVAFGICYESLQKEHFQEVFNHEIDFYIASVAKAENGINRAYSYFQQISREFKTPVMMSNCVGSCDGFYSAGQSAVWNRAGELVFKLDAENQGLFVYDSELSELI